LLTAFPRTPRAGFEGAASWQVRVRKDEGGGKGEREGVDGNGRKGRGKWEGREKEWRLAKS